MELFKHLIFILALAQATKSCIDLVGSALNDKELLADLEKLETWSSLSSDTECLDSLVRRNLFESAKFLLLKEFSSQNHSAKSVSKA